VPGERGSEQAFITREGPLRLLAITAHPDDESLGCGGALARYSHEGVETCVLSATRGERGRHGPGEHPGLEAVGRIREGELRKAANELGVREVAFLGYEDGALDQADPRQVIARIVLHLRRLRPQVVITFGPDGAYGHPDHIAVSQFAMAAVVCAADPGYEGAVAGVRFHGRGVGGEPTWAPEGGAGEDGRAHRVSKLYYMATSAETWAIYQETFKTLTSTVDGIVRQAVPWPDWAITTRVDAGDWWRQVWWAVQCHRTQMAAYEALSDLTEERHRALWGNQTFYRVFSTVNGGREVERDLFQGLREPVATGVFP
jgi:LmbE family N-acetylglucosaminyl deacetylase